MPGVSKVDNRAAGMDRVWWQSIAGYLLFWIAYAGLFIGQQFAAFRIHDVQVPISHAIIEVMCEALLWAVLSPLVAWTLRRHPPEQRQFARPLLLTASLILVVEQVAWGWIQQQLPWRKPASTFTEGLMISVTQSFAFAVVVLLVVVAVQLGRCYHAEARRRERLAAALAVETSAARLAALTAQLQPHFLFNALSTIGNLVHRDPARAERLVAELGDLLRRSLSTQPTSIVSVRNELGLLARYIAIQTARFSDRLAVVVPNVAQLGPLADAQVPPFVMQSLVENAIRHNLEAHVEPLAITLSVTQDQQELVVIVSDNGIGFGQENMMGSVVPAVSVEGGGLGLRNLAARLTLLFEGRARMSFANPAAGGAEVTVRLPLTMGAM